MRINVVIIIILVVLTGFLLLDRVRAHHELIELAQKSQSDLNSYSDVCLLQTACGGSTRLDNIPLISRDDQMVSLSDLTSKNKFCLIYRFTSMDCFECVSVQLSLLKERFRANTGKVKIIASYPGINDLRVIHSANDLRFPFFNTETGSLGLDAEKLHSPYFFLIDSALVVRHMFIPEKQFPHLTQKYFDNIQPLL